MDQNWRGHRNMFGQ